MLGFDYEVADRLASALASHHEFLDAVDELRRICATPSSCNSSEVAMVSQSGLSASTTLLTVSRVLLHSC